MIPQTHPLFGEKQSDNHRPSCSYVYRDEGVVRATRPHLPSLAMLRKSCRFELCVIVSD